MDFLLPRNQSLPVLQDMGFFHKLPEEASAADSPAEIYESFQIQVAGHGQLLQFANRDSCFVYKPWNQREFDFYTNFPSKTLQSFCAKFYGVESHRVLLSGESGASLTEFLKLENLLHGYKIPCVMDVKIGTRLYCDSADAEKKEKMIRKAASTTSGLLGCRLCGMRVSCPSFFGGSPKIYGREFCLEYTAESFDDGICLFFPGLSKFCQECKKNPAFQIQSILSSFPFLPQLLRKEALLLKLFTSKLHEFILHFSAQKGVAMYSSSILFVYEGDLAGEKHDIRLIDFAQSEYSPLYGVDQSYLVGLSRLLKTFQFLGARVCEAISQLDL